MSFDLSNNYIDENTIRNIEDDVVQLWNKTRTKRVVKRTKPKNINSKEPLKITYNDSDNIIEAGIDEAGRGPLFGRVYTACVILPRKCDNPDFDFSLIKDSKKYSSKKKLIEVYNYITNHAIAYSVCYEDETTIDEINIRQATIKCMNHCISDIQKDFTPDYLLIDGCDFYTKEKIPFICIEGGDNLYTSIAAASILAKVERDNYIEQLCHEYPYLEDKYGIASNKGYGTKKHLDGIRQYGITPWHRRSFGICKNYS